MSLIDTISNFSYLGFNGWGYVVVFLAAFFEATPFFGLFVPGMSIVIAGGFMVKLGILNIVNIVVFASLGAILGDLAGYFLGKEYGVSFLEKYGKYFFFRKKQFEKTKMLMDEHAGKSLIIGRFNSLTRSFAPFIAGSMGTSFNRFLFFNIVGGITWAGTFVFVGFVFGQSYEAAARYIGKFITVAIIVSVFIVYLYRFVNKRKHIFKKYNLYVLILNLFSLYLFAKMAESIVEKEIITKFDTWVSSKVVLFGSSFFNDIAFFITSISTPANLFLLSFFIVGFFAMKKKLYYMILLTTSIVGSLSFQATVKFFIHKERPANMLINTYGYSFPSMYTATAVISFGVLLYAFKDDIKNKTLRILFIFGMICSFLLVVLSRLYLNLYWFSDMIAGFAVGLFCITLFVLILDFFFSEEYKQLQKIKKYVNFKYLIQNNK